MVSISIWTTSASSSSSCSVCRSSKTASRVETPAPGASPFLETLVGITQSRQPRAGSHCRRSRDNDIPSTETEMTTSMNAHRDRDCRAGLSTIVGLVLLWMVPGMVSGVEVPFERHTVLDGIDVRDAVAGDVDGDGDLDIVVLAQSDDEPWASTLSRVVREHGRGWFDLDLAHDRSRLHAFQRPSSSPGNGRGRRWRLGCCGYVCWPHLVVSEHGGRRLGVDGAFARGPRSRRDVRDRRGRRWGHRHSDR